MLDVRAACEDALQVDPAPLHVDPHVEEGHDAVQLVFPAQGVLLKHLADEAGQRSAAASPLSDMPEPIPRYRRTSYQVMQLTLSKNRSLVTVSLAIFIFKCLLSYFGHAALGVLVP